MPLLVKLMKGLDNYIQLHVSCLFNVYHESISTGAVNIFENCDKILQNMYNKSSQHTIGTFRGV